MPAKPTQPRWPSDAIHEVGLAHDRYWRRWSTYWHCFDSPEAKAFWRACASDGSTYTAAEFAADDLQRAKWALDDLRMLLRLMEEEYAKRDAGIRSNERIRQLRNVRGRTPEEAAAYRAKADELERRGK